MFGPTCDALDVISMAENLPATCELGDLLYSEEHRRLQPRLVDVVQRLPAREGGACEPVSGSAAPLRLNSSLVRAMLAMFRRYETK